MSLQLGKIKGISIRIHFTLIITFLLIDWTSSAYFMPGYVKGLSTTDYWIMGSVGTVLFFFSILLHELAHSLVAKRYQIPVRSITLFIFGGVSDIAKEPEDFHQEFKMSIVGPLTSIALGGVLGLLTWLISHEARNLENSIVLVKEIHGVLFYGAAVNVILGVFNLVPAFPLDGGRVLRAALVRWKKDYHVATKIATSIGVAISYVFMAIGLVSMIKGDFVGGIWIALVGWFLHSGAQSYMSEFEITTVLKGVTLGSIMNTNVMSVKKEESLDFVLKNYFMASMKSEFPVTDGGFLVGMITLKDLLSTPQDKRLDLKVKDIMVPLQYLAIMQPEMEADKVLLEMVQKRVGKVFVCNKEGRLLGLISKTDIIDVANERQKYLYAIKKTH